MDRYSVKHKFKMRFCSDFLCIYNCLIFSEEFIFYVQVIFPMLIKSCTLSVLGDQNMQVKYNFSDLLYFFELWWSNKLAQISEGWRV